METVNNTSGCSAIRITNRTNNNSARRSHSNRLFSLYFDDQVKQNIVLETNRYARQCFARKPDPKWYDTTGLGVHGNSCLHGHTQIKNTAIKNVMARDRFNKLLQYLHLNNNKNAIPSGLC